MTPDAIKDVVVQSLARVAPEIEPARFPSHEPLRDLVDIDSMDFLNFVVDLHERLGVDVPESDYASLTSIDAIVSYLSTKLGTGKATT